MLHLLRSDDLRLETRDVLTHRIAHRIADRRRRRRVGADGASLLGVHCDNGKT